MITATINRKPSTDAGTFGTFSITTAYGNELRLNSLELPSRANAINLSCVPTGIYTCEYAWSMRRRGFVYWVREVEDRTAIQMHVANYAGNVDLGFKSEVKGCIALGMTLGKGWGNYAHQNTVGHSADAFAALRAFTKKQSFKLKIMEG